MSIQEPESFQEKLNSLVSNAALKIAHTIRICIMQTKKTKFQSISRNIFCKFKKAYSYYLRQEQIIALEYEIIMKLLSKMVLRRLQKLGNYSLFFKKIESTMEIEIFRKGV